MSDTIYKTSPKEIMEEISELKNLMKKEKYIAWEHSLKVSEHIEDIELLLDYVNLRYKQIDVLIDLINELLLTNSMYFNREIKK